MDSIHSIKRTGTTTLHGDFPAVLNEFITAHETENKKPAAGFFSDEELQLTKIIVDIMLPPVSQPGAGEIRVSYFIELVVKNCFDNDDKQFIKKGLQQLDKQAGRKFSSLSKEEQLSAIRQLDRTALKNNEEKIWFRILKKLVTIGYFAAKDGAQKALQYVKVPGESNGCVPYSTGDDTREKIYMMYW